MDSEERQFGSDRESDLRAEKRINYEIRFIFDEEFNNIK